MARYDSDEIVEIEADDVVRTTDASLLVEVEGNEAWVAKSKIENMDDIQKILDKPTRGRDPKTPITLEVPRWLAKQNGWTDE